MKLKLEQLKQITTGAVNIKEENGTFYFSRFTAEQEELYKETNQDFYHKAVSPAGIKFHFKTDSKNLFLKLKTSLSSSRGYFSVDVFVNGSPIGYLDNFSEEELPEDYTQYELPLGEFSKNFELGEGEKTVCVHLPCLVKAFMEEVSLDDGAFIEGIELPKKLIAFGDSITHGYDAMRPSNRYVAKLAERLVAEEFNKGIGGEQFFPKLAACKDPIEPDYITVAYGTNDWSIADRETFRLNCRGFYENLSRNYPDAKIFAITPIWRKDCDMCKNMGAFETVEQLIRELTEDLENVTVIPGYDLVPGDERYFADFRLHPNDEGFAYYAKNLYEKIKAKL